MNDVRIPIETVRDGNKITKVCVEDFYKMINRIGDAEERSSEKWNEIWESLDKQIVNRDGDAIEGCLVIGTGTSCPNMQDAFDEEIGSNIAFIKAKLNANMKKRNVLFKLWNSVMITVDAIDEEINKIDNLIAYDLHNMRSNYNPGYLPKLDGYGYEIQEEEE